MAPTLLIAILLVAGGQESLVDRLRLAQDSAAVEELAREVPAPAQQFDRTSGELTFELGAAWLRVGQPKKCRKALLYYADPVLGGTARLLKACAALACGELVPAAVDLQEAGSRVHASPRILDLVADVTSAVREVVDGRLHDERSGALLVHLAFVRRALRDPAGALALADELETGWGETFARSVRLIRARVAIDQGRSGDAIAQLAPIGDPNAGGSASAFFTLTKLYEREGRWEEALSLYQSWCPTSNCGNGQEEFWRQWSVHKLRCRFHLGEAEDALRLSFKLAIAKRRLGGEGSREGADLWAELVAQAGRIEEARAQLVGVTAELQEMLAPRLELASLSVARNVTGILAVLARDPSCMDLAVRLVTAIPAAGAGLAVAIERGELVAAELAGRCHFEKCAASLERRLSVESDAARRITIESALIALARPRD
jgi:hypothetical protein